MNRGLALAWLLAAILLWPMGSPGQTTSTIAPARAAATAGPTPAEVARFTEPLIRPRLRIPDSLHALVVDEIRPAAEDASRFEVRVRFRARTPFGATTENRARFSMKRASGDAGWIVTAR